MTDFPRVSPGHVIGWCLPLLLAACAPAPAPVYDDELGLQAVPVAEGALAGTFALKVVAASLVRIPVPGIEDQLGGGVNYRLVRRQWDPERSVYQQTSQLCGGYNFEVAGVNTAVPPETYRLVPDSIAEQVFVEHEQGSYRAADHVQLWGITLPDPLNSPLPADAEEAQLEPHSERIYDMDEDEQPGITLKVSGLVSGEVWAVQRKIVALEGLVVEPDRILGLSFNSYESVVLGDDIPLYDASMGSTERWPDPKESWFEEVRIPDDSDCDDVMGAEARGVLSRIRPY